MYPDKKISSDSTCSHESETRPLKMSSLEPVVAIEGGSVVIAMATYNGARFVSEQIRTIQDQTFRDWVLLVRDDGSHDETTRQISLMAQQDARIRLLEDGRGNQGAIGNFAMLMEAALEEGADYLFFADQDDFWLPEKLSTMLAAMKEMESREKSGTPLLVHCDLAVVDERLKVISESFANYSRLSPATADLGVLLCQNQVTGCACLINRRLLELACPVPSEVLMHDWWLALLAAASGKIGFIPLPLVKYRQHGGNVLGAVSFRQRLWQLLKSPRQWQSHIAVLQGGIWQSRLLAERVGERRCALHEGAIEQIKTYARILEVPPIRRAYTLRRYGIGKSVLRPGWVFALLIVLMKNRFGSENDT